MQIKRNFYLQQLIDGKQNGLIKIITGIRRCGKSYLLFTLFRQHLVATGVADDHIIRIALDDIENAELRDPLRLYRNIKASMIDSDLYYILLDEVQLVPRFEEVLNSLLRIDNADVYVTGSNSKFLSSDIITEFRGRGYQIHVSPLLREENRPKVDAAMKFISIPYHCQSIAKEPVRHLGMLGKIIIPMVGFLKYYH